jgi:hypothetical protein
MASDWFTLFGQVGSVPRITTTPDLRKNAAKTTCNGIELMC